MRSKIFAVTMLSLAIGSCTQLKNSENKKFNTEVQGHRGDRGNFPENTIPAFLSAIKKGADVIELDVVISSDRKVVVSHEPFMSSAYVTSLDGAAISKMNEKSFNLYHMSYDSIKRYDVGSRGNKSFPEQHKMTAYKPLLSEVIDSVEAYIKNNKLKPVRINVEIKSDKDQYGLSQPQPVDFVTLVMQVIESKEFSNRINIQSFDPEILNIMHKKHPSIKTAYLTDRPGIDKNLSMLVFTPDIYSPHYKLINRKFLDSLHSKNMRVIPWTVNDNKDIDAMLALKVDGIITDYPERVVGKPN